MDKMTLVKVARHVVRGQAVGHVGARTSASDGRRTQGCGASGCDSPDFAVQGRDVVPEAPARGRW